jgi:ATP-binding protein involved in chromosome partitioning
VARTTEPQEAEIRRALEKVGIPGGGTLISKGMVSGVAVMGGEVYFSIEIDPKDAATFEQVRLDAVEAVKTVEGVTGVHATLTAHRAGGGGAAPRPARPQPHAHQHAHEPGGNALAGIAKVSKLIAVASGKGGVGKSTVAVNLAVALKGRGLAVGLLDADVYGPSVPMLSGLSGEKPHTTGGGKMLVPLESHGLKLMSMGFLVDEATPMIWRGPMVQSALLQMMRDVDWGALDVLIIDMPPGTGDAALTLAQQAPLAGAVVVSTPQDIALIDARKGAAMFDKVHVPVLGIVENMSYFVCPKCGERAEIFGHGGAREEAEKRGVPFLGEVPLDAEIRERSDRGEPVAERGAQDPRAAAFAAIADAVIAGLSHDERAAPKLSIN